jgi:putative tricarboxylic transport membrane protein
VPSIDRVLGLALALLAGAVLWSSRGFPVVPGQKVGAGLLPTIVGIGLMLCGAALVARSFGSRAYAEPQVRPAERFGPAAVVVGVVLGYLLLAERIGFLVVVPIGLLLLFRVLRVNWLPSLLWALGGTVVVHVAFYKLLRVPLPWGVFRPFY